MPPNNNNCVDCGILLTAANTKGEDVRKRKSTVTWRCGKCYLKWKRQQRQNGGYY